jgi:hypothetical protein
MVSVRRYRRASPSILVPQAEPARPVRGSQSMKLARIGLLAVTILVAAPGSTHAKVPWSSVEIEPDDPIAGEPMTVVVRFWADPSHTRPSPVLHEPLILEFHGPDGQIVPVAHASTDGSTFNAEVTLTEGTWRLVVDQDFLSTTGPTEVDIAAVTVGAAAANPAPIGAAVIGLTLVAAGALWRGRRSSSRN